MEAVLGERLQWVVVERFEHARDGGRSICATTGAGSATFLPLEHLPAAGGARARDEGRALGGQQVSAPCHHLVHYLLGQVASSNTSTRRSPLAAQRGRRDVRDPTGEVLGPTGRLRGGAGAEAPPSSTPSWRASASCAISSEKSAVSRPPSTRPRPRPPSSTAEVTTLRARRSPASSSPCKSSRRSAGRREGSRATAPGARAYASSPGDRRSRIAAGGRGAEETGATLERPRAAVASRARPRARQERHGRASGRHRSAQSLDTALASELTPAASIWPPAPSASKRSAVSLRARRDRGRPARSACPGAVSVRPSSRSAAHGCTKSGSARIRPRARSPSSAIGGEEETRVAAEAHEGLGRRAARPRGEARAAESEIGATRRLRCTRSSSGRPKVASDVKSSRRRRGGRTVWTPTRCWRGTIRTGSRGGPGRRWPSSRSG